MSRVVVTGAAGFIGSHLAERLLDGGAEVLGIDSFKSYYDVELKRRNLRSLRDRNGFELVEQDILDADLERLLAGAEVVYHLAAQPGVRRSWGREFEVYAHDNVLATQRLLEAARQTEPGRFVYASSSSIYGDAEVFPTEETALPRPVSPYGVTKLAAEHLCMLYGSRLGVSAVALRYFTVYGPRQRPDMAFSRFIEAALASRPIEIYGDGHQSRDFTFVADAVAATMAAAERGQVGQVYNVAGGSQATVLEVIAALEGIIGTPIDAAHLPAVPGDARRTGASTLRAQTDLLYTPKTDLQEGLTKQVEACAGES